MHTSAQNLPAAVAAAVGLADYSLLALGENTSAANPPWLAVWCQHRQHLQLVNSIVVL
jgi:hypothetical protein